MYKSRLVEEDEASGSMYVDLDNIWESVTTPEVTKGFRSNVKTLCEQYYTRLQQQVAGMIPGDREPLSKQ